MQEYLHTGHEPDMEFVDGALVERIQGEWLHALVQSNILAAVRRKYPRVRVVVELRSKTATTRYRIPDVSVLLAAPTTRHLLEAAFLVVEVLSEDDAMSRVMAKLQEYAAQGVPNIWLVDPRLKMLSVYRPPALVGNSGRDRRHRGRRHRAVARRDLR
ncbi:MAG: Uma2 family endonuclease [Ignavibacteriota bacterium]